MNYKIFILIPLLLAGSLITSAQIKSVTPITYQQLEKRISNKDTVYIVNFWATWCGPCKASFPGMQMAVNKYKDDQDVKFLFIDTWENGDNYIDGVKKFIADNKYTFNVLIDEKGGDGRQSKVVTQFGVSGIPTKFIIDKSGNIRFKVVGFDGSADGLVDEVSAMIDMAKEPASFETAASPKQSMK